MANKFFEYQTEGGARTGLAMVEEDRKAVYSFVANDGTWRRNRGLEKEYYLRRDRVSFKPIKKSAMKAVQDRVPKMSDFSYDILTRNNAPKKMGGPVRKPHRRGKHVKVFIGNKAVTALVTESESFRRVPAKAAAHRHFMINIVKKKASSIAGTKKKI
ncbi:hypothetical protein [Rhodococcus koreensis]|uniref:Uncharacterized protein n=1 Tax=Rhodococcus koreensis TaxID=99653 RepID=A0A1H4I5E3_9NOCA|nr:hypothetical protein [Rhodococcus koreensis]SEB29297.1 hypothetical protein SAMN04490239_0065 [Rhodococcus koreensis]